MTQDAGSDRISRSRFIMDLVVTIALIAAAGVVIWAHWPTRTPGIALPKDPVPLDDIATRGSADAKVVLLEYSDPECQYCGRFARDTLPLIDDTYVKTGQVRFAYRHLPAPRRAYAFPAALAIECAGRQERFFEMHDLVFEDQTTLAASGLLARAERLGLDTAQFGACLKDAAVAAGIKRDSDSARELGITSTPTFLIGIVEMDGRVRFREAVSGAMDFATFRTVLDRAIRSTNGWPSATLVVMTALLASSVATTARLIWRRRRRSDANIART